MKRYLRWALRIAGLYLLFLVAYFAFAFASMTSPNLAIYERKINPSTFVFWQEGQFYESPPMFSSLLADSRGQLSNAHLEDLDNVDIWVLLLAGVEDIHNVEFASSIGVDVTRVASSDPGLLVSQAEVALSLRKHPIPFYVRRKKVVIVDALHLQRNYRAECLDEMVYGLMINQRDQGLWERCKTA